jgi:hypothetical protein
VLAQIGDSWCLQELIRSWYLLPETYPDLDTEVKGRPTAIRVSATAVDTARGEQPVLLERHAL